MVDVVLYAFSKRRNSTKQPTEETAEAINTYQVLFKEPFSVTSPVIIIRDTDHGNMAIYNYAYIDTFSRYYYITDATYDKGRWFLSLEVDALASHKAAIGNINTYILRSASRYDGTIQDSFYPAVDNITKAIDTFSSLWTATVKTGYFVVGITNDDQRGLGAVTYYVMNYLTFTSFTAALSQDISWMDISTDEISQNLTKALFNPFQYISSVMWYPFKPSTESSSVGSIRYGWWSFSGITAQILSSNPCKLYSWQFTVNKHPQNARGVYLNYAPYSRYTLFIPCFGEIPIDANIIGNVSSVHARINVDCITGQASMQIQIPTGGSTDYCIGYYNAQVGVPIQIASLIGIGSAATDTAIKAVSTGISTVSSGLQSFGLGNVSGLITSGLSGVSNILAGSITPQYSTGGSNGNISTFNYDPYLRAEFIHIANEDNTDIGRPLCAKAKINTLSGYVLCREGEFASDTALTTEVDTINDHLTGGFYYE